MTDARHDLYTGCEVVCVDDKVPLEGGAVVKDAMITEGNVYRIRWIGVVNHYVFGEYLGVRLEGVDSKFGDAWGVKDCPYHNRRFKPLIKDKLASLKQIAADPDGWKPDAKEGPLHPNGPLPEPVREGETV